MVVQRGEPVEFRCGSNETEPVNWNHRSSAASSEVRIVAGGIIINSFRDTFSISEDGTSSVLTLYKAFSSDAGTFTCIDKVGFGERVSAELIVLGE